MDWSGWVGVGVAIAFGGIAWAQGSAAGKRASEAQQDAQRLEERLAQLTGSVGVLEREAVQTRQLAEGANDIARGALEGVQEVHDVGWDGDWEGESYTLTNTGQDEALSVRALVTIDDVERRAQAERVGPGEKLFFDFAEVVRECREDEARRRRDNGPFMVVPPMGPWVHYRMHWKSRGGVAHEDCPNGYMHSPEG